jgi:hypothetical protein
MAMAADEIRAAILASPDLKAKAQAGAINALAGALSAGRISTTAGVKIRAAEAAERYPDAGALPGPLAFEAVLLALEAFAIAKADSTTPRERFMARATDRALIEFKGAGLDFGRPALRDMLTALVPTVLTQAQASALLGLAERPDRITEAEVRAALFDEVGRLLLQVTT